MTSQSILNRVVDNELRNFFVVTADGSSCFTQPFFGQERQIKGEVSFIDVEQNSPKMSRGLGCLRQASHDFGQFGVCRYTNFIPVDVPCLKFTKRFGGLIWSRVFQTAGIEKLLKNWAILYRQLHFGELLFKYSKGFLNQ